MKNVAYPQMKEDITAYLERRIGSNVSLSQEDDIFALGLVNSMFALQLIMFLESEYNITIENEDLELKNFNTVNNIVHFIGSKKSDGGH